ncbi:nuclear apoptosis-inducing factor 1 isoform X2 [Boleophthalmus pectinirostris]|uniref:nuclear apoptosis-inducing factor 1 isoform X2 n=1 Tax=Boleophthalmus pectinirostris TaxID=150288 RepID=UPI000A1C2C40|nr:nuclear apoptosis-inducing factor 1 isoform X2 [Boleophthalmus pectinirostris]
MSSSPLYYNNNNNRDRFKKRKARFTFSEVHILLDEVRKHRKIVVGKFNRGVPTDAKKRTWAEITARVNEIGECQREIIEVIKKWSDLKCDTKRKIAAMQTGAVPSRGLNSRMSKDLNPTEKIVAQILEMSDEDDGTYDFSPLGDDDEGVDEEEMEEEDMMGFQSSPNGGLETAMPPPSSYLSSGSGQPDTEAPFAESEDEQKEESPIPSHRPRPPQDHHENNGIPKPSPAKPEPSTSTAGTLPMANPAAKTSILMDSVSQSLREQHATNTLLETVSRSLELLAESVQQLAETQQEFVRESLQLQRETVQVLRDFTGGAIALIHDKLNGRPAL